MCLSTSFHYIFIICINFGLGLAAILPAAVRHQLPSISPIPDHLSAELYIELPGMDLFPVFCSIKHTDGNFADPQKRKLEMP